EPRCDGLDLRATRQEDGLPYSARQGIDARQVRGRVEEQRPARTRTLHDQPLPRRIGEEPGRVRDVRAGRDQAEPAGRNILRHSAEREPELDDVRDALVVVEPDTAVE